MRQLTGSDAVVRPLIVSLALACVACVGTDRTRVTGSGVAISEERQVEDFSQLTIEGAMDVQITVAHQLSLTVEGDDNIVPLITTEVRGRKLVISSTQPYSSRMGVRITASVPQLAGVSVNGSGDVDVQGVHGESFAVAINGSGDVTAGGEVQAVRVAINGSGDVKLGGLQARTAKVAIAGSGDVTINASEALDVSIAGSGDVKYVGTPKVTRSIAGSGNVRQAG